MKIPRDVSGDEIAKLLSKVGYQITKRSGSHLRLTTFEKGEHHVTIPAHASLKIGTLNSILKDVAAHLTISKEGLIDILWK